MKETQISQMQNTTVIASMNIVISLAKFLKVDKNNRDITFSSY